MCALKDNNATERHPVRESRSRPAWIFVPEPPLSHGRLGDADDGVGLVPDRDGSSGVVSPRAPDGITCGRSEIAPRPTAGRQRMRLSRGRLTQRKSQGSKRARDVPRRPRKRPGRRLPDRNSGSGTTKQEGLMPRTRARRSGVGRGLAGLDPQCIDFTIFLPCSPSLRPTASRGSFPANAPIIEQNAFSVVTPGPVARHARPKPPKRATRCRKSSGEDRRVVVPPF
jgi:hypothetical protein